MLLYSIPFIYVVLLLYSFIVLIDKNKLIDPIPVNTISIIMGMLGLPAIVLQISELLITSKKKVRLSGECPHCGKKINYEFEKE